MELTSERFTTDMKSRNCESCTKEQTFSNAVFNQLPPFDEIYKGIIDDGIFQMYLWKVSIDDAVAVVKLAPELNSGLDDEAAFQQMTLILDKYFQQKECENVLCCQND